MSRPRTATALLDARESFKRHPERKREDPIVSDPVPTVAPSHLDPLEVKCWHNLREATPDAVLTGADVETLTVAARLLAETHKDFAGMATARIGQLISIMGKFGMSPADRAKLAMPPKDDDGDF